MNILKENSTIIIIIIYGYILFKYIEENDYVTMGIVTFIAALIAYKLRKNVEGFTQEELEAKTDVELRNIAQNNGISSQEVDTLISDDKAALITMIIQAINTDEVTAPETDITSSTDTGSPSQADGGVAARQSGQGGALDPNRVLPGESQEYRKLREEARSSKETISDDAPSAAGATTLGVSDGKGNNFIPR